ncbi:helix-turn-helix domain-containing protein [Rasiella sp. SM2506]|uniref:helix-turn-helix domain-containing protein n=1 Tax=Rasiella sp. SM2506 TaxID=3423914 RepID=UPI003D7AD7F7
MEKDYFIKNMVCDRCIKVLKNEIEAKDIKLTDIELGRIRLELKDDTTLAIFKDILDKNGFSLINSTEVKLTEQIKITLIRLLDYLPIELEGKLSVKLAESIGIDYSKMSKVFSFTEGVTIEKYFIKLKIEKVKELIQANELNFTEISQLLDYSHINHLSRQFKTETGMSLTQYKNEHKNFRNSLDQII